MAQVTYSKAHFEGWPKKGQEHERFRDVLQSRRSTVEWKT